MVFSRRINLQKRPVDSRKHILDNQGGLVGGTQTFVNLVKGVDNPLLANPIDVQVGARVNSIFLNVIVASSNTASLANVYMMVFENPSTALTMPNANAVGVSDHKKQVFHQEMTMTEKNTTAIPRTLFKGVLSIPKHFRRIGQDDTIAVALFSPGNTFDYCVQCIYKEYR